MKKKRTEVEKEKENDAAAREYPLREVQSAAYMHVRWTRADLFHFTDSLPKLRVNPDKWYTHLALIVTFKKCCRKI